MSPSMLLTSGYLLACLSCMYNIKNWGVELHLITCLLIIVGIISFMMGEFVQTSFHKPPLYHSEEMTKIHEINVSTFKICLFSAYNLLVLILTIQEVLSLSGGLLGTIGKTIGEYRYAYSYTEFKASTLNVQLLKVSKGAAYTFLYIFFNNVMCTKKSIIKNIKYLAPTVIFAFITLLKGGRINTIMLIIAALFIGYYLWHRKVGWDRVISFKFIKKIVIAFLLFAILFFGTREFVGRRETTPFAEYITTYLGGSFQLFDQYLTTNAAPPNGFETIPGIMQSLQKLGLRTDTTHKSLEFRYSPTGVHLGNVYTGLRRYYHDFGIAGIFIIQFVYGYLFSFLYNRIKKMRYLNTNRLFLVTVYSSLLFCIITQAMEDHFWIDLGLGFFVELIIMLAVAYVILEFSMKKKFVLYRKRWRE